jgi:hypothetical protein
MAKCCSSCRFWLCDDEITSIMQADGNDAHGWCRRRPPQIVDHMARMAIRQPGFGGFVVDREDVASAADVHRATLYPATFGTEWCGEFKRAEAAHG